MLRKFAIWLVRTLITILIISLIFSFISLKIPTILSNLFEDVFSYSSPAAQNETLSKLATACSSMQRGTQVVSIDQLCSNASKMDSIRDDCDSYRTLKSRGIAVENEEQIKKTCDALYSGEIQRACSSQRTNLFSDLGKLGELCGEYGSGKINDREFFAKILSSPFGNQQIELPQQYDFVNKYWKTIDFFMKNKIWYFLALAFLVGCLYLLLWNLETFLVELSGISFSVGLLIMLPYLCAVLFNMFVGIDTTTILTAIFGNGAVMPSSILSVIILLFLRTYSSFILILGIILLGVGMAGKGYKRLSNKEDEPEDKKDDKKEEKEDKKPEKKY